MITAKQAGPSQTRSRPGRATAARLPRCARRAAHNTPTRPLLAFPSHPLACWRLALASVLPPRATTSARPPCRAVVCGDCACVLPCLPAAAVSLLACPAHSVRALSALHRPLRSQPCLGLSPRPALLSPSDFPPPPRPLPFPHLPLLTSFPLPTAVPLHLPPPSPPPCTF